MSRDQYIRQIFDTDVVKKLHTSKVLMVGAGGIGCELLKNLTLVGIGEIHVIDLDTIDLSNLNRQFLFRKEHIAQPKAFVAKESAGHFNPNVNIVAYHDNIKDSKFNVRWFKSFDLVFNALDNLDARRHVNRFCLAANVPLIESGTAGFQGQVQVILPGKTECYDCNPKPRTKSFPICTIRSTPSEPVHCIAWAKSYLFSQLFEPEAQSETLDDEQMENGGKDDKEKQELLRESNELKELRESIMNGTDQYEEHLFNKVFQTDINRLLSMDSMWKTRKAPKPLDYSTLKDASSNLDLSTVYEKDQKVWTLEENFIVFIDSLTRLISRKKQLAKDEGLSFDKDDEDTLDFVVATANIRSLIFSIPLKSKFDIKQIAGNIIPAIATTNAVIAGVCVLQALKVLQNKLDETRMVFLSRQPDRIFSTEKLQPPNPNCVVCGVSRAVMKTNVNTTTLGDVVEKFLKLNLGYTDELSVVTDKLIYDPDFDDNMNRTLADLKISDGSFMTVIDEEDENAKINLEIYFENSKDDMLEMETTPTLRLKPAAVKQPAEDTEQEPVTTKELQTTDIGTVTSSGTKRKREDSEPPEKRQKLKNDDVIVIDEDEGIVELD